MSFISFTPVFRLGALATAFAFTAAAASAQACPDWRMNGSVVTTDAETAWAPQRYSATAGGTLDLAQCTSVDGYGFVSQAPSFTITYDAQNRGLDLDFRVEAGCDALLVVNDATANWHYNDDSDGTLNPRIRLAAASSGVYDVWVGTYGQASCAATLVVETFPASGGQQPQPQPQPQPAGACPEWSRGGAELTLAAGGHEARDLVAGGSISLFNSCNHTGAYGHVAEAPDFTLYYTAPEANAELQFAATGDCDTLLLVNDLRADWVFNDDSEGLNPAISIPNAESGRYDIWVGTYGPDLCRANFTVTAYVPEPPAPGPAPLTK